MSLISGMNSIPDFYSDPGLENGFIPNLIGTRLLWIESPFVSDILDDSSGCFEFENTLLCYKQLFITIIKDYVLGLETNEDYSFFEETEEERETFTSQISGYYQRAQVLSRVNKNQHDDILMKLLIWSITNRFFLRDVFTVIRSKGADSGRVQNMEKWIFSDISKAIIEKVKTEFLSSSLSYLIRKELEYLKTRLWKSLSLRPMQGWAYWELKNSVFNTFSPMCSGIIRMAFAMSHGICLEERIFWPVAAMEFYCYGRYFKPVLSAFPDVMKERFQSFCTRLRDTSRYHLERIVSGEMSTTL